MPRQKALAEPILRNYDEVDSHILEWANIDSEITKIADKQQAEINNIKAKFEKQAEPLVSRKMRLQKDIEDFCLFNKDHFEKEKTRILTYGKVGFRKSTKLATLKGWTWAKVLNKLKDLSRFQFIRVKEEPNKEAIRDAGLSDKEMATFGVEIKEEENFWFEPDKEAVANAITKLEVVRKAS